MNPLLDVLHVIHSGGIGGGPRVVLDLATLIPARHTVCTADDGPLLADATALGVSTRRLAFAGEFSFGASLPQLTSWCRSADIVHLHGQFAAFYGSLCAAASRTPSVYTAHFPSFVTDAGVVNRVRNRIAEELPCRLASEVIACSETMRAEYVVRRLVSPGKIQTIVNGVSVQAVGRTAAEVRQDLGFCGSGDVVLAIGRFTQQKGFDMLLRAWPQVLASAPDAHLVLVGDGEMRDSLEILAAELRITGSVRFTGFRRDIPDFLEASSLVVVPSRYDIFPLVPLEAMMAGRAVVATDLDVLAEAVTDGETGRVVPSTADGLATGIVELLNDGELRGDMGLRGRQEAQARFTRERMAQEYQHVYERIAGRRL